MLPRLIGRAPAPEAGLCLEADKKLPNVYFLLFQTTTDRRQGERGGERPRQMPSFDILIPGVQL